MKTKTMGVTAISTVALFLAACGKEAPPPAAVKKDEAKQEAARPLPPSAPTAAPAEGEKKK